MLGESIRQARVAAGMTLEGLASSLERPISKQALSKYERGQAQPPLDRLADIAAALSVPPSVLLSERATAATEADHRSPYERGGSNAPDLRTLARMPLEERRRALAGAIVEVDPEETKWWDAFDDASAECDEAER